MTNAAASPAPPVRQRRRLILGCVVFASAFLAVGALSAFYHDSTNIANPVERMVASTRMIAKIPTLVMFGDHLGDVTDAPFSWSDALDTCRTFADQLHKAGGDAEVMYLPALGIKGNSHMLMQDRNSVQLADLVIAWLDRHVENRKSARR